MPRRSARRASGALYAGVWRDERVAVKVYNNAAKTSDGRPEDEMTASVLAATIKSEGVVKTVGGLREATARSRHAVPRSGDVEGFG